MRFLDIFFPKYCLGCGRHGSYFCPECLSKLQVLPQICPVCEQGSIYGQTHSFCQTKYSLDGLISFYPFGGIIRQAIHKLKYQLVTDLKDELFSLILREAKQQIGLSNFLKQSQPIVIPIPLYWRKENLRGFNQSSLLGQAIAKEFNLKFSDQILLRQKSGPSQTKLTMQERKKNVKDVFTVSSLISGLRFNALIVDDVWTTGATLKTAGNLLKRHGAQKVWAITLAR